MRGAADCTAADEEWGRKFCVPQRRYDVAKCVVAP
jgi:hypothetical protein